MRSQTTPLVSLTLTSTLTLTTLTLLLTLSPTPTLTLTLTLTCSKGGPVAAASLALFESDAPSRSSRALTIVPHSRSNSAAYAHAAAGPSRLPPAPVSAGSSTVASDSRTVATAAGVGMSRQRAAARREGSKGAPPLASSETCSCAREASPVSRDAALMSERKPTSAAGGTSAGTSTDRLRERAGEEKEAAAGAPPIASAPPAKP